jgi:hypothetical protein
MFTMLTMKGKCSCALFQYFNFFVFIHALNNTFFEELGNIFLVKTKFGPNWLKLATNKHRIVMFLYVLSCAI